MARDGEREQEPVEVLELALAAVDAPPLDRLAVEVPDEPELARLDVDAALDEEVVEPTEELELPVDVPELAAIADELSALVLALDADDAAVRLIAPVDALDVAELCALEEPLRPEKPLRLADEAVEPRVARPELDPLEAAVFDVARDPVVARED